jgi:hypothetical protein
MKKYLSALGIIVLVIHGSPVFACDPIAFGECNSATIQFDEKSWAKLAAKSKELDAILDQYISQAPKDRPRPNDSCFNQHLYTLNLESLRSAAKEKSGRTCREHLNLASSKIDPYNSAEIKYAFNGDIPTDVRKLILEFKSAHREFVLQHRK